MSLIKILSAEKCDTGMQHVCSFSVERPVAGDIIDAYSIQIVGWILCKGVAARSVLITSGSQILGHGPVFVSRPEISVKHVSPKNENCGFRVSASLLSSLPRALIEVIAVLEDNTSIVLYRIRTESCFDHFQPSSHYQPLMVTSLGRTGTTWLMKLLSLHDEIIARDYYPLEARASTYWMQILKILSSASSFFQAVSVDSLRGEFWWLPDVSYHEPPVPDTQLRQWLTTGYIRDLIDFSVKNIDQFYLRVAQRRSKKNCILFAEKHIPNDIPQLIWNLYPGTRELILVRDFRDMVSSMLAFNKKRGFSAFGREKVSNDKDFIISLHNGAKKLLEAWEQRKERAYLVRYEDLVLTPAHTLSSVLSYAGVDDSERQVNSILKEESQASDELIYHRTSSTASDSIGRWQNELSDSLKEDCQNVFGDILRGFGYQV